VTKVLILTLRHLRASEAFDSNQSTGCFSRIEKQFRRAGHVRHGAERGSTFRELTLRQPLQVDGTAVQVIQAPKPQPRIRRYE
jgi:hypothetical protein